jgi:hypothetical protein
MKITDQIRENNGQPASHGEREALPDQFEEIVPLPQGQFEIELACDQDMDNLFHSVQLRHRYPPMSALPGHDLQANPGLVHYRQFLDKL